MLEKLNPSVGIRSLHKSIAGRYQPVREADGPITARCRFIKNASWEHLLDSHSFRSSLSSEIRFEDAVARLQLLAKHFSHVLY